MFESSEGLADWTRHHVQEIHGIRPRVSAGPSDLPAQLLHLSHPVSHYCSRSQKTETPSNVDYAWKLCVYVGTIQRICLFSDDFYSDSTRIVTTTAVNECINVDGVFLAFLIFVLILAGGLCCAWFIYPVLCWLWFPEMGASSIDQAQLSRFRLKTETESNLRKAVCFK
jgi:hypothetical protein